MTHTNTKTMKQAYQQYIKSDLYCLRDCYTSYSVNKERAFEYCLELVHQYNGRRFRIVSYNLNVFTFGFIGEIDGKQAFFYITRDYDRYIYLDELNAL